VRRLKLIPYFFAGDDAGVEVPLAATGDEAGLLAIAGLLPGLAASAEAGRIPPRFAGFASILAAKVLTILASEIATSTSAELRICFR